MNAAQQTLPAAEHWRAVGAAAAAYGRSINSALSEAPGLREQDWIRQGHDNWTARNADRRAT